MAELGAIGSCHSSTATRIVLFVSSSAIPILSHSYTATRIVLFVPSSAISILSRSSTATRMILYPSTIITGVKHSNVLASKTIQIWSNRANYTMAPAGPISQVYLQDNPGTISGTVKTAGVADAFYTVRLYYRPNGYLIDQIRTNLDGTFTFSKDIDKAEIKNYYVMAFDANGTANAVVYDLITAG